MGIVVIREIPMTFDECIETASKLGAMTAEEIWEIVTRVPSDVEEQTKTLPNGNILTLRRKRSTR